MFYCDPCADKNGWPRTAFKSRGRCEDCGQQEICNDMPSSSLPFSAPTESIHAPDSPQATPEERARAMEFAGELHNRIHEVAALVSMSGVEIGWAPEDAIPMLADGLLEFAAAPPSIDTREPAELPGKELPPLELNSVVDANEFCRRKDAGLWPSDWTYVGAELCQRERQLAAALQKIEVSNGAGLYWKQRAELAESQLAERDRVIGSFVNTLKYPPK